MIRKNVLLAAALLSMAAMGHSQKAYMTKVLEYVPAPGQFVHELPAYADGDTADDMVRKCLDQINNEKLVSLGGFGGYITVGFDHQIVNVTGEKDVIVLGNAFDGNAEPGIIMVSVDENSDGLPNDTWYEIAGSEHGGESTLRNYEVTYTRPAADDEDVPWRDNYGRTGFIKYMGKVADGGAVYDHSHAHYPKWIEADEITFKGTCLPKNGAYDAETKKWVMRAFDFGYADNKPSTDTDGCSIDLDWAVDAEGNSVSLAYIDFIRVYTGVNQQIAQNVGELSTEISDIRDLHPEAKLALKQAQSVRRAYFDGASVCVDSQAGGQLHIVGMDGRVVLSRWMAAGTQTFHPALAPGIYVLTFDGHSEKFAVGMMR